MFYCYFRYFCTRKNDTDINLVPEMQECGIWNDIVASINLVAYHSESLVYHVNNNAVESYNSIVVKYIGGKRINFSFKGDLTKYIFKHIIFYYKITTHDAPHFKI